MRGRDTCATCATPSLHRIVVPRVRCRRCGRTAALLPWFVTPYRWDTVDVIGRALELAISGQGVRRIAASLARPEATVREWCRRFGRTADVVARVLLAAAVRAGWWAEGLAGLHNRPRSDRGAAPVSPALLDEAIRLGLQVPARSAVHISEIVFAPPRRAHRRAHPERAGPAAGLHPNRAAARRTRVRAVRGRRSQRALDRRRPRGAPSCPTGGLPAPCGPACPRSSTITAASSSMAAGSATRPCVRARRCSTRRSCAGACPPSSA